MKLQQTVVLIPSHSLEDLPTDLDEVKSAQLMNAFILGWDPYFLASTEKLPSEVCAEISPEALPDALYLIPEVSEEELPGSWIQRANERGSMISLAKAERFEWLHATINFVNEKYPEGKSIAESLSRPEFLNLRKDFHALGFCYLMLGLLSRKMRYYPEWDRDYIREQIVQGAQALVQGDLETVENRLKRCFEIFLEARERFHPMDCYFLDLCILIPEYAGNSFMEIMKSGQHFSLITTTQSLNSLKEKEPELFNLLQSRIHNKTMSLAGGEWTEGVNQLFPFTSQISQFRIGLIEQNKQMSVDTEYFASRAFNLSAHLPDHLERAGMKGAIHLALEEGTYPVENQSRIDWQGACDLVKPAMAKIPFAADSAASFLQYPEKMAEAMDHEHIGCIAYIHWPQLNSPWFQDLTRVSKYYPVLGKFVTLHEFLNETPSRGHLSLLDQKFYRTAALSSAVARKQTEPISRWKNIYSARRLFDAFFSTRMIEILLASFMPEMKDKKTYEDFTHYFNHEKQLEEAFIKASNGKSSAEISAVQQEQSRWGGSLTDACLSLSQILCNRSTPGSLGLFFYNPVGAKRVTPVKISHEEAGKIDSLPKLNNLAWQKVSEGMINVVDLPAYGYAYIDLKKDDSSQKVQKSQPMVEDNILQTDGFQVIMNTETGGISQIKNYGRKPNRISQQLTYRFQNAKLLHGTSETTYYSHMICDRFEVTENGSVMGEITTHGRLVDPEVGDTLAEFVQQTRVYRKCPFVEVTVKLNPRELPRDNPWRNYYALRFAWNNTISRVRSSIQQRLDDIGDDRVESTDCIEIIDENMRTSIVMPGLPYHIKTHGRMLDTILIPAGEIQREFTFRIAIDQLNPMIESYNMQVPVYSQLVENNAPPAGREHGWFFYPGAKNVVINRLFPASKDSSTETASKSMNVELVEMLGVDVHAQFAGCFPIKSAKVMTVNGNVQKNLHAENKPELKINVQAHRTLEVKLEF